MNKLILIGLMLIGIVIVNVAARHHHHFHRDGGRSGGGGGRRTIRRLGSGNGGGGGLEQRRRVASGSSSRTEGVGASDESSSESDSYEDEDGYDNYNVRHGRGYGNREGLRRNARGHFNTHNDEAYRGAAIYGAEEDVSDSSGSDSDSESYEDEDAGTVRTGGRDGQRRRYIRRGGNGRREGRRDGFDYSSTSPLGKAVNFQFPD